MIAAVADDAGLSRRLDDARAAGVPNAELEVWRKNYLDSISDCGCSTAAQFTLAGLLAFLAAVLIATSSGREMSWLAVGSGLLAVFLGGGAGKVLGLWLARRRSSRLLATLSLRVGR